ncbi:MAG: FtsX-like permease family protein [Ruminococcaceae bacterium]|nr:FtsX-like permease family protein [Oscillospiraceae bacterium]
MNMKQSFSLALKSLKTSKMRSFLTMLGIIIGVASVIILTSMVDSMKQLMVNEFESMGTNLITVIITGRGGNRMVEPEDMIELVEKKDTLAAVSPNITIGAYVKNGNENQSATCIGTSENYHEINNLEIDKGRYLSYIDVERRQKNCVIGSYVAESVFEGQNPVGRVIKINGYSFTVVGVAAEKSGSVKGGQDDRIYLPYTVARTLTFMSRISNYTFSASDKDKLEEAIADIEEALFKVYQNDDFYSVTSVSAIVDTLDELTGTLTLILVGIAGISLLVGGIGIMNIMLVSVTERTREIGVRKSLGATPWNILSQFLVEAATTSGCGGILGIILGIGGAYLLCSLMDLPTVITLGSILIAFSVSAVIGMAFGYFPAKKAARLNPIDALRYD